MNVISDLTRQIVEAVQQCDTMLTLQPARIGEGMWQNELLLFIKPEVFLVSEPHGIEKSVDLVLNKIKEFNAHVEGIAVVSGRLLEEKEIMNRHYGFINLLSRSASQILNDEDKKKIEAALDTSISTYTILGGHEYLAQYPSERSSELDHFWFSVDSIKIGSGFYVRPVSKDGQNIILVNGFHPQQLAHFTQPDHKIVLMLLHSNTAWSTLRNDMVGATFPEKASPASLRGTFYARAQEFGFVSVTVANNCVHLSAGPFEALFEIVNFFGRLTDIDVRQQPPLILRRMVELGITYEHAIKALENPPITFANKAGSLFSATEDMNTDKAVKLFKNA